MKAKGKGGTQGGKEVRRKKRIKGWGRRREGREEESGRDGSKKGR